MKRDWGIINQMGLLAFSLKLEEFVASVGRAHARIAELPWWANRPDLGLAVFWTHITKEWADTCPLSRFAAAKYLLAESPESRYIFKILRDEGLFTALTKSEPSPRFIIYCEHPLTLWYLEMLMDSLSVLTETRREEAARAFDNADSGIAVQLVAF